MHSGWRSLPTRPHMQKACIRRAWQRETRLTGNCECVARLAEQASKAQPPARKTQGRALRGNGQARVAAAPQAVWAMLLDPNTLAAIIPGCHGVTKISDTHFRAEVTLGVGPVSGRYKADIALSDLDPPKAVTLSGSVVGALGDGRGDGRITLTPSDDGGTQLAYDYDAEIGGKVASIGGRLLDGAAKIVIRQFFEALARHAGGPPQRGWLARLLARLFWRRA